MAQEEPIWLWPRSMVPSHTQHSIFFHLQQYLGVLIPCSRCQVLRLLFQFELKEVPWAHPPSAPVDADLHGRFPHHVIQSFCCFNVEGTHQQYPLSKQELLHGGEDSQSFRPVLIVHIVVAGMTIHQSPHPIISCNHDSEASQDVGWVHRDVLDAWSDTMKSWILAERHKDWSCRQLVNTSDRFGEPLCIVPFNPNMVWMSVRDEECKWYPEMDGHILLGRNVRHHALDQVLDRIEELLGSGHALEAVDVDDRDGISHFIKPILNVRCSHL